MMRIARHIKLEAGGHTGAVRFLTGLHVSLQDGKTTSWVTVTRTGRFSDPRYGQFNITRDMLLAMVKNFDERTLGQDVFIDVSHRPSEGVAGKILKLTMEGDRLRALVEWTPYGIEAIRAKGFRYLSAEYSEDWQDNEQRQRHGPLLLGAGLTSRPVIKRLDPVQLAEADDGDVPVLMHPELESTLLQELQTMWKELLKTLSEKLKSIKLADAVVESLTGAAEKALASVTDETAAKALIASFEESGVKLAEQIGDKVVQLAITAPQMPAALTADDVKKLMADEAAKAADAAKKLAETKDAKVKLLTDTIGAAQGLDDELKKTLAEKVADLVTAEMTDDQVKRLAQHQIDQGNELVAARKLADMGYQIPGTAHISVDSGNEVKKLQETVDRRLGLSEMSESRRFAATGGKLQDENKAFADKVLAQFDREQGRRLHEEHKQLAGGDSVVSDTSIPAIFERTVIREALYQLTGLQFVDVGTYPFSALAQIPYSYRDTTAAGASGVRTYEGGSIQRAAVKQAMDEARPIPQKLAFEVSDELRYLTANGQISWDIVAENTRNASRIIGEDTDTLIFNEQFDAADQYATTDVSAEAVATTDGTKKTFVLAHFPVVRPQKAFDLSGTQQGSTSYPVTVKLAGTAVTLYDGSGTQSAGTYYKINYSLGEITFCDESGTDTAPAASKAVTADYTYTTNAYAFDTDLDTNEAIDDHWDTFLYRFGLRKAVIEDDRFYQCNFGLMSGTVRTMIEQAKQFSANFSRPGTNLSAEGNLGAIKAVPQYKTSAPGLLMGDVRIGMGQRGVTRFRMMKPWTMNQLENQKDSNGRFTGKKEAYGDQFIVIKTPQPLRAALTQIVLYSTTNRVNR